MALQKRPGSVSSDCFMLFHGHLKRVISVNSSSDSNQGRVILGVKRAFTLTGGGSDGALHVGPGQDRRCPGIVVTLHIFWHHCLLKSQSVSEASGSMIHASVSCQALSLFLGPLLSCECLPLSFSSLPALHPHITEPDFPLVCSLFLSFILPSFSSNTTLKILLATFWQSTALYWLLSHLWMSIFFVQYFLFLPTDSALSLPQPLSLPPSLLSGLIRVLERC